MFWKLTALWLMIVSLSWAQNPQTQTAPIYQVNAKYTNGVAPGYAPTAGSGLVLNIGPGTANCSGSIATYSGGTFTLTASVTNYIYLNTAASCVPATKTSAFTSTDIPLAVVVTGSSAIVSITDDRTPFNTPGSGGGGGSGVQYNPPTTAYIFSGFSGPYDDNHELSSPVSVANYSCASGVCTVNTSVAHGLLPQTSSNHNNYVDVTAMSGFGATQQVTNNGSFAVVSVPSSTQLTFTSSTVASCSSSCGSIYDASYWGLYRAANQPFLYSHGTVYGIEDAIIDFDTNFSSLVNCNIGSPTYLIIEGGQNELNAGTLGADLLPHYLSIWSKAHAAGCLVIQGSLTAANYGGFPLSTIWPGLLYLNANLPTFSKSFSSVSTGQYWDRYIDFNAYLANRGVGDQISLGDTPAGADKFAQLVNNSFASQGSNANGPFPFYSQGGRNNEIAFGPTHDTWTFYESNLNPYMTWGSSGVVTLTQNYGGNGAILNVLEPFSDTCGISEGHDANDGSHNNDAFNWCFNYTGPGSTSNYAWFGPTGSSDGTNTDILRMYAGGTLRLPQLTASSGNQPLQVDTSGNVSVGVGSTVNVNGFPVSNPNFNGTTPAAPTGSVNVTFQPSGSSVSAYVSSLSGGTSGWSGTPLTFVSNATQYAPWVGGAATSLTEAVVQNASPATSTISNLQVNFSASLGTGTTLAVTLRDATVSTALTCTTASAGTSCSDITHAVNMTQGDKLDFILVASGTVSAGLPQIVISYTVGTPGGNVVTSIVSPGTNTTCTPLVAGKCVGDVTINASGSGGSGLFGQIISQPTISSMGLSTPYNQQGTFSASNNSVGIVLNDTQAFGSGDHIEGIVKTYPGVAFTATILMNFSSVPTGSNAGGAGFVIATGTSGALSMCEIDNSIGSANLSGFEFGYSTWTNPTTFSARTGPLVYGSSLIPVWVRWQDTSSNYICSYSADGLTWQTLKTGSSLGYTLFGLGLSIHNSTNAAGTILSYSFTTP